MHTPDNAFPHTHTHTHHSTFQQPWLPVALHLGMRTFEMSHICVAILASVGILQLFYPVIPLQFMGATSLVSRRYYLEIRHHEPLTMNIFMPFLPRFFQSLGCHGCSTKVPSGVRHPMVTYSLHWIVSSSLKYTSSDVKKKKSFYDNLSVWSLIYGVKIRINNMVRNYIDLGMWE